MICINLIVMELIVSFSFVLQRQRTQRSIDKHMNLDWDPLDPWEGALEGREASEEAKEG